MAMQFYQRVIGGHHLACVGNSPTFHWGTTPYCVRQVCAGVPYGNGEELWDARGTGPTWNVVKNEAMIYGIPHLCM